MKKLTAKEYFKKYCSTLPEKVSHNFVIEFAQDFHESESKKEIRDIRFKVKSMILTIHSHGVDMRIITKQLDEIFPNKKT